jgi:hypothetical protein
MSKKLNQRRKKMELKEFKNANELRKHIFGINDLTIKEISVPEWNCKLYAKGMSGKDKEDWEKSVFIETSDGKRKFNSDNFRAKMVASCVYADPEAKEKVFTEEHYDELSKKSAKALDRILEVVRELNGSTEEAEEEMAKNLGGQEESSG